MSIRNSQAYAWCLGAISGIIFTLTASFTYNQYTGYTETESIGAQLAGEFQVVRLLHKLVENDGHGSSSIAIRKINTYKEENEHFLPAQKISESEYARMSRNAYRATAIENLEDYRRNIFPEKERMEAYLVLLDIEAGELTLAEIGVTEEEVTSMRELIK